MSPFLRRTALGTQAKKQKTVLTMGTHSGTFQCDEALGTVPLVTVPLVAVPSVTMLELSAGYLVHCSDVPRLRGSDGCLH